MLVVHEGMNCEFATSSMNSFEHEMQIFSAAYTRTTEQAHFWVILFLKMNHIYVFNYSFVEQKKIMLPI